MIQTIIKWFNYITIRTINKAIFSEFKIEYLNSNNNWIKHNVNYCGYHKYYNPRDWRFKDNNSRINTKYIKLKFIRFL